MQIRFRQMSQNTKNKYNKWSTMEGTLDTSYMTNLDLKLPELYHNAEIYAVCHLTDKLLHYDLIRERDILHELGIIFKFKYRTVTWQEVSIPMKPSDCNTKEFFVIKERCPV